MTKPKTAKHIERCIRESRKDGALVRSLRLQIEKLQEQVRKERRRADEHAEEIAFLRQQQVEQVRQRLNGVTP